MVTPNAAAAGTTPMDLIWNDGVVPTWLAGMSLGFVLLFPILRALFPKSMKQEGAFLLAFELTCSVPVRDDSPDAARARAIEPAAAPLPPFLCVARSTRLPSRNLPRLPSSRKPIPVFVRTQLARDANASPRSTSPVKNPSAFPLTRPPHPPSPFSRIALSWRRARITA